MEGSDDDVTKSPLQGGRGNLQQRAASQQRRNYSFDSPRGRQQILDPQVQAVLEQEILLRRQIELQQDLHLRRRLMHETHQQIMSELEHRKLQHLQQQLQQQQHPISSPLLQQYDLQRLASQEQQLSMQEEQLYLQQQRQLLLRQQMQQQIPPPFDFSPGDATTKQDAFSMLAEASSATSDLARQRKRGRQDSIGRLSDDSTGQKRSKNSGKKTQAPNSERSISGSSQDRKLSVAEKQGSSIEDSKLKPRSASKPNYASAVVGVHRERAGSENFGLPGRSQKKNTLLQQKAPDADRKNSCSKNSPANKNAAATNGQSNQYGDSEFDAANGLRSILLEGKKAGPTGHQESKSMRSTSSPFAKDKEFEENKKDSESRKAGIADLLLRLPTEGGKKQPMISKGTASKKQAPEERKTENNRKPLPAVPLLEEEDKKGTEIQKDAEDGDCKSDTLSASDKQLSQRERELFAHLMHHNPGREQIESLKHDNDEKEKESQDLKNKDDKSVDNSKGQIAALIANLSQHAPDEEEDNIPFEPERLAMQSENKTKNGENVFAIKDFSYSIPSLPVEPEYTGGDDEERDEFKLSGQSEKVQEGSVSGEQAADGSIILANGSIQNPSYRLPGFEQRDVKGPVIIHRPKEAVQQPVLYCTPVDTWWPSNNTIRRERRLRGYRSDEEDSAEDMNNESGKLNQKSQMSSLRDRIENFVEPGVLEKLPHCKLYLDHARQEKGGVPIEPLFCCQVTESFCTDPMVCCSICSSWRHAACGGHYKRFKIDGKNDSEIPFTPICDLCYEEDRILRKNFKARCRIGRQRTEHLRRALSTSSVIRQAAFAKHSGQYKWPLGAVSATHISGHTRSVHGRHERSLKQWGEMATKLGNGLGYRPKERLKVRTRELERLLSSVEDAEGVTDRHNIMVFLQRDTSKKHPAGFEMPRWNFFDPEEDEYIEEEVSKTIESEMSNIEEVGESIEKEAIESQVSDDDECSDEGTSPVPSDDSDQSDTSAMSKSESEDEESEKGAVKSRRGDGVPEDDETSVASDGYPSGSNGRKDINNSKKKAENDSQDTPVNEKDEMASDSAAKGDDSSTPPRCANEGCKRKPRFDSVFCSDACGVSALELDLLHSFEYASDIHPSLLRP